MILSTGSPKLGFSHASVKISPNLWIFFIKRRGGTLVEPSGMWKPYPKLARVHSTAECLITNHAAYLKRFGSKQFLSVHHKCRKSLTNLQTLWVQTERKHNASITSDCNMSMRKALKTNVGMKTIMVSNVKVNLKYRGGHRSEYHSLVWVLTPFYRAIPRLVSLR